jgi:hypothetical protein
MRKYHPIMPFPRRYPALILFSLFAVFVARAFAEEDIAPVGLEVSLVQTFDESELIVISPDGLKMLIEDWGEKGWPLRLIEIGTWKTLNNYNLKDRIISADFFSDSQNLFIYENNSLFNLQTGEQIKLKVDFRGSYLNGVYPVNDHILLIRQFNEFRITKDLVLIELPTYREIKTTPYATQQREAPPAPSEIRQRKSQEFGFGISNNREILAYSFDHVLVCRRTRDLEVLWTRRIKPPLRAYSISLSPNGKYLAAILADTVYEPMRKEYLIAVYDGKTGSEIARLPLSNTTGYAVSPDGRLLALSERELDKDKDEWVVTMHIHELPSCKKLVSIQHDRIKNSSLSSLESELGLSFTRDGRYIIASGMKMKIWELSRAVAETEITLRDISSK